MAGQLFALHYTAGVGAGAVGTGVTMHRTGTVGILQGVGIEALDYAGIAFTFGSTADIYRIACGEGICFDDVADVQGGDIVQTEFFQGLLQGYVRLGKVTLDRFGGSLVAECAETDLHGLITVVFDCLLLHYHAGAGLYDRYRYYVALFIKELGHTDLLADDTFLHLCVPPVRLLVGQIMFGSADMTLPAFRRQVPGIDPSRITA